VFNLLAGEPEYLDTLKDETPEGWWVTGYPWSAINTAEHRKFRDAYQKRWKDYPRQGSVVGYTAIYSVFNAVRRAKSTETEKLVEAMKGLEMTTPFGPIVWRPVDHQSTMGTYVGRLANKGGKGVMTGWRYADGALFQPSFSDVKGLRKE
jgi:branched-chain amino acid transport system substrate-binding protein